MPKCPICEKSLDGTICQNCGYDASLDFENHPTVTSVLPKADSLTYLKKNYKSVMEQRYGYTSCPVCDAARESLLCQKCGFDESRNYETHFTFNKIGRKTPSVERRKREREIESFKMIRCPSCSGTSFSMDLNHDMMNWFCNNCGSVITSGEIQDQRNRFTVKRNQIMQGLIENPSPVNQEQLPDLAAPPIRRRHLAAGVYHFVLVHNDGTVSVFGQHQFGKTFLQARGVVSAAVGASHVVAIQADKTLIAAGGNMLGKCDVSPWKDIVDVSCGIDHTVGLSQDGTVLAVGSNIYGQCDTASWKNIVHVAAGNTFTIGITDTGRIKLAGDFSAAIFDEPAKHEISAVAAGSAHFVVLYNNGTVFGRGNNSLGQCNVGTWRNIIAVSAKNSLTVGLRSDGTIVTTDVNLQKATRHWRNILEIAAGDGFITAIQSDGTVLSTRYIDHKIIRV